VLLNFAETGRTLDFCRQRRQPLGQQFLTGRKLAAFLLMQLQGCQPTEEQDHEHRNGHAENGAQRQAASWWQATLVDRGVVRHRARRGRHGLRRGRR